jgi:hypothetical protein
LIVERLYEISVLAWGDDVIEAYIKASMSVNREIKSYLHCTILTLAGKLMAGGGEYKS